MCIKRIITNCYYYAFRMLLKSKCIIAQFVRLIFRNPVFLLEPTYSVFILWNKIGFAIPYMLSTC